MINPQQRNQVQEFQNLSREKQAEKIANICNQNGITLEQLKSLYSNLR